MRTRAYDLYFEDEAFACLFSNSFADICSHRGIPGSQKLFIDGTNDNYRVLDEQRMALAKGLDGGSLAFRLTVTFGEALRSRVSRTRCTMHASSACVNGKAIVLVGRSGAGKTSLSLLLARYGVYLGDEYASVDLNSGRIEQEPYPVQIKEEGQLLFPGVWNEKYLLVAQESGTISRLVPVSCVVREKMPISHQGCEIGAIVFPHYAPLPYRALLKRTPVSRLLRQLLESCAYEGSRRVLLPLLLELIERKGIPTFDLFFSDGETAAAQLAQLLD